MSDQEWAKEVADAVAVAERATGRSWWVDVLLTEVKKSQTPKCDGVNCVCNMICKV